MSLPLTEEQLAGFREAFALYDANGDGKITREELSDVWKSIGLDPTDAKLNEMIDDMDVDGDGKIDFHEFITPKPKNREEVIRQAFKTYDKNGDGFVTSDELDLALKDLGENLSKSELDDMMKQADTNGDGKLDYNEIVKVLSKTG